MATGVILSLSPWGTPVAGRLLSELEVSAVGDTHERAFDQVRLVPKVHTYPTFVWKVLYLQNTRTLKCSRLVKSSVPKLWVSGLTPDGFMEVGTHRQATNGAHDAVQGCRAAFVGVTNPFYAIPLTVRDNNPGGSTPPGSGTHHCTFHLGYFRVPSWLEGHAAPTP